MTTRIARLVSSALSVDIIRAHRLSLPPPGDTGPARGAEDREHLPTVCRAPPAAVLTAGMTMLETCETLASADAGSAMTILETDDRTTHARGQPRP